MFALKCDACNGWCHLKCQKGVTVDRYRTAVRKDVPIDFLCPPCEASVATAAVDKRQSGWFDDVGLPVTESTRLSDTGDADEAEDADTYRFDTVAFTPYGIDGKFHYIL